MSSKTKTTATKEEATPALVPKLRFPEFRGAGSWTTEALGSVAKISTAKVGDKTCIPMSITSGVGLVSQMDKFGRIIAGSSYANYLQLKKNDFAYNKSATKEYPEGFIALYTDDELAAVPNSIFTCFRVNGSSPVPQYLNYLFLGNLHGRWLRNFIEVGARAHGSLSINQDDLLALPIPLPSGKSSVAEQQKIAECLSSVDELMAAQARKLDALKTHKKGLMQQLFPREGETQPRLRFPEFKNAGEWDAKTFGDVSEVLMCKRIFAEETNPNAGVPFYKIGTLGGVPDAFISREKFEDYKSRYNYPMKGEVLITCSGTVGKCLPFDGKDAYFQDSNIVWLANPTGQVSNEFLFMLLSNVNWSGLNSTTITRIYGPDLRGMAIKYPQDKAEQQRIASCLTSLDELIAAQTQKLEALKTHKKGLMQQLFPSPEVPS
jgi:type I restriction enzyme S subunit